MTEHDVNPSLGDQIEGIYLILIAVLDGLRSADSKVFADVVQKLDRLVVFLDQSGKHAQRTEVLKILEAVLPERRLKRWITPESES